MKPKLKTKIEAILFIAARPLSYKKIAESVGCSQDEVATMVEDLANDYQRNQRGFRLLRTRSEVQMTTASEAAEAVGDFLKDETTGVMSRPSLETLAIISYRGPITKAELEQIRGINCGLILRNLMVRSLIEIKGEVGDSKSTYTVTADLLRFLGLTKIDELPDYKKLNSHEALLRALEKT